jgi:hypothetical protein
MRAVVAKVVLSELEFMGDLLSWMERPDRYDPLEGTKADVLRVQYSQSSASATSAALLLACHFDGPVVLTVAGGVGGRTSVL